VRPVTPPLSRILVSRNGNGEVVVPLGEGETSRYLRRVASPTSLADVVDLVCMPSLKHVPGRVSGKSLVTVQTTVVVTTMETFLRLAEAVERLDPA
jgi:hypothetical protein